jgi:hypothetical protein
VRIQYGERGDLPPELKKQKAKRGMFKDLGMISGMKCVSIVHLCCRQQEDAQDRDGPPSIKPGRDTAERDHAFP